MSIKQVAVAENGGNLFLRSIDWLSKDYTALYPRR
jgi:hypothetical protein